MTNQRDQEAPEVQPSSMPARHRFGTLSPGILVSLVLASTTACTSRPAEEPQVATLRVHIGLFGGPSTSQGKMALRNSPAGNENVTAVSEAGQQFTGVTDAAGVATMHLAPGTYSVFSTYCGVGDPATISLIADESRRVQIVCPIP